MSQVFPGFEDHELARLFRGLEEIFAYNAVIFHDASSIYSWLDSTPETDRSPMSQSQIILSKGRVVAEGVPLGQDGVKEKCFQRS